MLCVLTINLQPYVLYAIDEKKLAQPICPDD